MWLHGGKLMQSFHHYPKRVSMSLRKYIQDLEEQGRLTVVRQPISKVYEIAGALKQLEPQPVRFARVSELDFGVAGNLFCSKAAFAEYLGIKTAQIIPTLMEADRAPFGL